MDYKFTKSLYFVNARYRLSDGSGDEVNVTINYEKNNYRLEPKGNKYNSEFRKELEKMAKDLLIRKHGVNIVEKPLH
jgi:hypothetical protein